MQRYGLAAKDKIFPHAFSVFVCRYPELQIDAYAEVVNPLKNFRVPVVDNPATCGSPSLCETERYG